MARLGRLHRSMVAALFAIIASFVTLSNVLRHDAPLDQVAVAAVAVAAVAWTGFEVARLVANTPGGA